MFVEAMLALVMAAVVIFCGLGEFADRQENSHRARSADRREGGRSVLRREDLRKGLENLKHNGHKKARHREFRRRARSVFLAQISLLPVTIMAGHEFDAIEKSGLALARIRDSGSTDSAWVWMPKSRSAAF